LASAGLLYPATAPTNLVAVAVTPYQINLSWTVSPASGTNIILGYKVYRNGVLVPATGPSAYNNPTQPYTIVPQVPWNYPNESLFSDSFLTANTSYSYQVAAFDSAGNTSPPSVVATVATPPPITIPTAAYIQPFYTCAANYYVSAAAGNDSTGNGSIGAPWASISRAIAVLTAKGGTHGGVCVNVAPGTYAESVNAGALSGNSDTAAGYFVLRSTVLHGAIIENPPDNQYDYVDGISFTSASNIVVDGFTVDGSINQSPANLDGVGINIAGSGTNACTAHHIKVFNNIVHGWGGSGIATQYSDYNDWEGNVVYGNCNFSQYGESGIDPWVPVALDTNSWSKLSVDSNSVAFHYIIRGNIAFYNEEIDIAWASHYDGCGIELDTFNGDGGNLPYLQRSLVDNNLCFGNGGAGIETGGDGGSFVTLRNNTCYDNVIDSQNSSTARADIAIAGSLSCHDNVIVNNIAWANPAANPNNVALLDNGFGPENTNNLWANNLSYNGTAGQSAVSFNNTTATITAARGNLVGSNPIFANPLAGNFLLLAASPAIAAGTRAEGLSPEDLAGNPQTSGMVNMGAYEFTAPAQVSAAVLAGAVLANHQLTFTLTGTPGSNYVVQATTNLNLAAWISLATNPAPFVFTDTNAGLFTQRFYRSEVAR
jgi:serralysin